MKSTIRIKNPVNMTNFNRKRYNLKPPSSKGAAAEQSNDAAFTSFYPHLMPSKQAGRGRQVNLTTNSQG